MDATYHPDACKHVISGVLISIRFGAFSKRIASVLRRVLRSGLPSVRNEAMA